MYALLIAVVIPGILFSLIDRIVPKTVLPSTKESIVTEPNIEQTTSPDVTVLMVPVSGPDNVVRTMKLEEYLVGVILGEMPIDFNIEALKAQAVVARTYTLRRNTTAPKHEGGAVCTEAACCQSYCSQESYLAKGGSADAIQKAVSAVAATQGMVITYNNSLIEATYFSCSGGRTEDAVAVWGTEIPYLQAVDSPGEEKAAHYIDSVSFTAEEFADLLGLKLSDSPTGWFGTTTYTDGRGVDTMVIGGVPFKGTELRQKLGIRSTAFTVTPMENMIHITTKGFGHRVGMSQYGAEAMAVMGSKYQEILTHYYPGTALTEYNCN